MRKGACVIRAFHFERMLDMSTPRTEPNSGQTERFAQLHADVAAFTEEMHLHSVRPADPRKAWLPFGLGAGAALTVFVAAALFQRLI
jgi:alpha-beta hydrolase superfamily lysophospholipase